MRAVAEMAPAVPLSTAHCVYLRPGTIPARSWSRIAFASNLHDSALMEQTIDSGCHFLGDISRGLASIVEKAVSKWGLPNGSILGGEPSGAVIGGLRYGEGRLYIQNARVRVFWQAP